MIYQLPFNQVPDLPLISIVIQAEAPEAPKPAKPKDYEIKKGDTLTSVAKANGTTVQRLWAKNTGLKSPDLIEVGDKLIIPLPDEKLEDRAMPATIEVATSPRASANSRPSNGGYSNSGNTYTYGYCTWYVKNRRGNSLPNGLGHAYQWLDRAQALGLGTGSVPRPGAVGTRGNHVVYVESVSNGMVTISEMNYQAWNTVSYRTLPANYFSYIY